ncbi:MAG: alanine racemase [Actinomycetota bacterium]
MVTNNDLAAWVEVDLRKLDYNFSVFKSLPGAASTKIMAVVKADGYGHGAYEVSRRALANGAYGLGVARVQEGKELRNKGIACPIYILGEVAGTDVDDAVGCSLIPSISSLDTARVFNRRARESGRVAKCHINIDTGMNRLGINYCRAAPLLKEIKKLSCLEVEGIFTHFSCASDKKSSHNRKQIERFEQSVSEAEEIFGHVKFIHSANSAAVLSSLPVRMDMARLGIAMYGLNPFDGKCPVKLKPLLSLKARVSFMKKVARGETVSYCGTCRAKRDITIATFPVGYADGYSRLLSNRAKVIIGGEYAPVAGNITMDQFMADITHISGISVGDAATLIGESRGRSVTADDLARIMGTINYEIVCMIRSRVPRIFIG